MAKEIRRKRASEDWFSAHTAKDGALRRRIGATMNRSSATPAQDGVVEMKANVDAKHEGTSNPVLQHLRGRMGRGIQQPFTVHTHRHYAEENTIFSSRNPEEGPDLFILM